MIFYPFLLSIYPILFLYTNNINELGFSQTIIPGLVALSLTASIYYLLVRITKKKYQSGFFTGLLVFIIFYYSRCFDFFETFGIIIPAYRHNYLIVYILTACGYLIYFSKKYVDIFLNITKFLNIAAFCLIMINLFNIVLYTINSHHNRDTKNPSNFCVSDSKNQKHKKNQKPDIYFIILDEYASSRTIKDIFNYNNSSFEDYLIKKGFYIAKDSKTSSHVTPAAIASILNMERIKTGDLNYCFNLLKKNMVSSCLKNKNYTVINFPIRYYEDNITPMKDSDITFKSNTNNTYIKMSNFNTELIEDSIFRKLFRDINYKTNDGDLLFYSNSTNFIFNKIEKLIETNSPKFIYAHIECPHAPYVFNKSGKILDKVEWEGAKYYLGQYIYITTRTKKLISNIIKESKQPPVIIIQSDHGPHQKKDDPKSYFATKPNHTKNIFNAMLIPNIDRNLLYPNISPENTFRLVFKHLFNENLTLLID